MKWAVRLAVWALIAAYAAWDRMALGFSWHKTIVDLTPAFVFANVIVEVLFAAFLRLQKRVRYPSALAEALGAALDLRQAATAAARLVSDWLGARAAVLTLAGEGETAVVLASSGLPSEALRRAAPPGPDRPPIAALIAEQRAVISKPSDCPFWGSLFDDRHLVAYIPLVSRDRVAGVLSLVGGRRSGDLRNRKLLEALGIVIGLSLDNLRLHQREYQSIMQVLCSALDMRDSATQGHSRRVAHLAGLVARQMGLTAAEVKKVEQAAVLHDIGKIGIADAVLSKPGPLNEDEWTEMRRHPQLGFAILEDIDSLKEPATIVHTHHERFDGRGYPLRLKGEQIPIGARIFAVVDSYDAMTTHRPYRRARPHEEAIEEIVRHSGSQFDPAAVHAFLELDARGLVRPHHLPDPKETALAVGS